MAWAKSHWIFDTNYYMQTVLLGSEVSLEPTFCRQGGCQVGRPNNPAFGEQSTSVICT